MPLDLIGYISSYSNLNAARLSGNSKHTLLVSSIKKNFYNKCLIVQYEYDFKNTQTWLKFKVFQAILTYFTPFFYFIITKT